MPRRRRSVSKFKNSGLDETELKWNSEPRGCYPTCSLSGWELSPEWDVNVKERKESHFFPPTSLEGILWKSLHKVAHLPCVYSYWAKIKYVFQYCLHPKLSHTSHLGALNRNQTCHSLFSRRWQPAFVNTHSATNLCLRRCISTPPNPKGRNEERKQKQ